MILKERKKKASKISEKKLLITYHHSGIIRYQRAHNIVHGNVTEVQITVVKFVDGNCRGTIARKLKQGYVRSERIVPTVRVREKISQCHSDVKFLKKKKR